jgi:hypothetical protein
MIDPAPTSEVIVEASEVKAWPFETATESAEVPPPKAPAPVAPPPPAPPPVADIPVGPQITRTRTPRSEPAATPKAASPKVVPDVEGLIIADLIGAVESFKDAEKRHRASALEEVELRIKVVKAVLGL